MLQLVRKRHGSRIAALRLISFASICVLLLLTGPASAAPSAPTALRLLKAVGHHRLYAAYPSPPRK